MARSLGGGGGSHSFGGGGSRSFGGSHSSGSRSFGGFHASSGSSSTRRVSSGSSHHSSGSFYGGGLPPRPPRYGRSYYRRGYSGPVIINNGGGAPMGGGTGCSGGCLKTALWFFLIVAIVGILASFVKMRDSSPSSYNTSNSSGYGCTKYTGEVDKSHGYWEDHSTGEPWIDGSNKRYLEEGFESFYNETGVWPYLYVTDKYGSSGSFATYEEAIYDELFGNCPGNLLFVFIGNEESYYIAAGTGNGDVINNKTIEVFQNKINKYWSNGDLGYIFGKALEDAGKQLMKEEKTQLLAKDNFKKIMIVLIIAAGVVIVLIIAMSWWQKKKKAQKEEDERLEQILSQPLSTFGNVELNELGKKYDNVKVPAGTATGSASSSAATASDSVLNAGGIDTTTTTVDNDSVLNHNNDQ